MGQGNAAQAQLFGAFRQAAQTLSRKELKLLLKAHMPRHHSFYSKRYRDDDDDHDGHHD